MILKDRIAQKGLSEEEIAFFRLADADSRRLLTKNMFYSIVGEECLRPVLAYGCRQPEACVLQRKNGASKEHFLLYIKRIQGGFSHAVGENRENSIGNARAGA